MYDERTMAMPIQPGPLGTWRSGASLLPGLYLINIKSEHYIEDGTAFGTYTLATPLDS